MAKKAKKEQNDDLYIGIKDPVEIRRTLLESSRFILKLLQRNERFKSLRDEKAELFSRLKKITKDLSDLETQLKAKLPKQALKRAIKPKLSTSTVKPSGKKIRSETTEKVVVRKPASALDKLESSLAEIEDKLKDLS